MSLATMNTDQKLSSFQQRLANKIGARQFNRLIESVADAKRAGRLRFWLERFIENLPVELTPDESEFLDTFGDYESFLYVFGNSERLKYNVPREEFDADPIKYVTDSKCDVDDDWFRDAWEISKFRDDISCGIAWTIALTDHLNENDDVIKTLVRVLTDQDAAMLYESIRSELQGPEDWRHHFVRVFPAVEHLLPPPNAT